MSQGMKAWEPEPKQFVVRFRCGCEVRFPANGRREYIKCDMANGCFFDEALADLALTSQDKPSTQAGLYREGVTWGWSTILEGGTEVHRSFTSGIVEMQDRVGVPDKFLVQRSPAPGCKLTGRLAGVGEALAETSGSHEVAARPRRPEMITKQELIAVVELCWAAASEARTSGMPMVMAKIDDPTYHIPAEITNSTRMQTFFCLLNAMAPRPEQSYLARYKVEEPRESWQQREDG